MSPRDFRRESREAQRDAIGEPLAERKNGHGGCASGQSSRDTREVRRVPKSEVLAVLEHWREVCEPLSVSEFTPRQFLIVGERLRDGWSVARLTAAADAAASHKNLHPMTVPDVFGTSARVRTHLKNAVSGVALGVQARFWDELPGALPSGSAEDASAPISQTKICVKRDTIPPTPEEFRSIREELDRALNGVSKIHAPVTS